MLAAPTRWFAAAPGVSDTGPFNPHFVADVGFAFLATGVALLLFAWRPNLRLLAFGAQIWIVLHALLHLWGIAQGHVHNAATDVVAIAAPAALGLFITWPRKEAVRA